MKFWEDVPEPPPQTRVPFGAMAGMVMFRLPRNAALKEVALAASTPAAQESKRKPSGIAPPKLLTFGDLAE